MFVATGHSLPPRRCRPRCRSDGRQEVGVRRKATLPLPKAGARLRTADGQERGGTVGALLSGRQDVPPSLLPTDEVLAHQIQKNRLV